VAVSSLRRDSPSGEAGFYDDDDGDDDDGDDDDLFRISSS
jgi:hypothetical protein